MLLLSSLLAPSFAKASTIWFCSLHIYFSCTPPKLFIKYLHSSRRFSYFKFSLMNMLITSWASMSTSNGEIRCWMAILSPFRRACRSGSRGDVHFIDCMNPIIHFLLWIRNTSPMPPWFASPSAQIWTAPSTFNFAFPLFSGFHLTYMLRNGVLVISLFCMMSTNSEAWPNTRL